MKKILMLLVILSLIGCQSNVKNDFSKTDQKHRENIIGSWIVDASKHKAFPAYMEYYEDGTATVYFYDNYDCEGEVISKQLWSIFNGYLYYTSTNIENWSQDKIIKIEKDSYIMQSKEVLYRVKGSICKGNDQTE